MRVHKFSSYVAIGDSFTEGVGDELSDGRVRGWADLVAVGLAYAAHEPVSYANLAIRGRLLAPIIDEQLDAALALKPSLLSINGGGNDILRPRVAIARVADQLLEAVDRATSQGIHVVLASGANPSAHMPLGAMVQARGEQLAQGIRDHLRGHVELASLLESWVEASDDWELVAPRTLSLLTIAHRSGDTATRAAMDHVNASGHAFITHTVVNGRFSVLQQTTTDAVPAVGEALRW